MEEQFRSPITKDNYIEMMNIIVNDFNIAIEALDNNCEKDTVYNFLVAKKMTMGFCALIRSRFNLLYHDMNYSIIQELWNISKVHQSSNFLITKQSEIKGFICDTPRSLTNYVRYNKPDRMKLRMVLSYRKELAEEWLKATYQLKCTIKHTVNTGKPKG